MCKVIASVLVLAFCCHSYVCSDKKDNTEEGISMSEYMKRLDQEMKYPQFPDFSYPTGQFPGLPIEDDHANYQPLVNEQDIRRLQSIIKNQNMNTVDKVVEKVTDAILEVSQGSQSLDK